MITNFESEVVSVNGKDLVPEKMALDSLTPCDIEVLVEIAVAQKGIRGAQIAKKIERSRTNVYKSMRDLLRKGLIVSRLEKCKEAGNQSVNFWMLATGVEPAKIMQKYKNLAKPNRKIRRKREPMRKAQVLKIIESCGPVSRKEISNKIRQRPETINYIIYKLINDGIISRQKKALSGERSCYYYFMKGKQVKKPEPVKNILFPALPNFDNNWESQVKEIWLRCFEKLLDKMPHE